MLRLNNAGDSDRNPIITGIPFRIKYHKHDENETLARMWVTAGGNVISELTARCTQTDYMITCDVVAGTDLLSANVPVLNTIHVSTTYQAPSLSEDDSEIVPGRQIPVKNIHVTSGIFVGDVPNAIILLDGYNAEDSTKPTVFRPNA